MQEKLMADFYSFLIHDHELLVEEKNKIFNLFLEALYADEYNADTHLALVYGQFAEGVKAERELNLTQPLADDSDEASVDFPLDYDTNKALHKQMLEAMEKVLKGFVFYVGQLKKYSYNSRFFKEKNKTSVPAVNIDTDFDSFNGKEIDDYLAKANWRNLNVDDAAINIIRSKLKYRSNAYRLFENFCANRTSVDKLLECQHNNYAKK